MNLITVYSTLCTVQGGERFCLFSLYQSCSVAYFTYPLHVNRAPFPIMVPRCTGHVSTVTRECWEGVCPVSGMPSLDTLYIHTGHRPLHNIHSRSSGTTLGGIPAQSHHKTKCLASYLVSSHHHAASVCAEKKKKYIRPHFFSSA